jgi:hypothetical protein
MDFRTRISLDGMGPEATTQTQSQPSPAVYPGTGKEHVTERESLCMMAGIVIGMLPGAIISIRSIITNTRRLGQERRRAERRTRTGGSGCER